MFVKMNPSLTSATPPSPTLAPTTQPMYASTIIIIMEASMGKKVATAVISVMPGIRRTVRIEAAKQGVSMGAIVKQALDFWMDAQEKVDPPEPNGGGE